MCLASLIINQKNSDVDAQDKEFGQRLSVAASFSFHLVVVEQSSCVTTGECTFDFHCELNLYMATFYESGDRELR